MPFPYIISLIGEARYTPLTVESMLPFWYLVGSDMLDNWNCVSNELIAEEVLNYFQLYA